MRRLLIVLGAAACVAGPAAALTVTSAPNRDQAQHLRGSSLNQTRAPRAADVDLRDTLAADQRPFGGDFSDTGAYGRVQTFNFGDVSATIVATPPERDLRRPAFIPGRPAVIEPEWVSRRR